MKHLDFISYLKELGVEIKDGKRHYKAYYKGKQTVIARHPTKDYSRSYMNLIKKQLNLKR